MLKTFKFYLLYNLTKVTHRLKKREEYREVLNELFDLFSNKILYDILEYKANPENQIVKLENYMNLIKSVYFFSEDDSKLIDKFYNLELLMKNLCLDLTIKCNQIMYKLNKLNVFREWDNQNQKLLKIETKLSKDLKNDLEKRLIHEKIDQITIEKFSLVSNYSKLLNYRFEFSDISNSLKSDEVAIEFCNLTDIEDSSYTSRIYCVLLLRRFYNTPILITLFEEKQLDSIFQNINLTQFDVTSIYRGSTPVKSTPKDEKTKFILYNLIWKPIEPYLKKGDKIYYAPSGKLHNVSMPAIATSDSTYLCDDYELHQVSTTAKLIGEQKAIIDIDKITLYGGIAYEASDKDIKSTLPISSSDIVISRSVAHDSIRGGNWDYLTGTKSELDQISAVAKKFKVNAISFTGYNATEESYKNLQGINSPSILHIATHGFFYPIKNRSKKEMEMMQFNQEPVFTYAENPLNRSGLLFAGSNKAWQGTIPEDREDGILTAYEASNVYLPNTKLAVLSACETGLGDIKGSEGVYGMQRALKMAGVEYILMSLWKIPDEATAEYMTIFYNDLFKNKNIEAAYHKAQKDMKSKYPKEPYKWGGFVLVR